MLYRVFFTAQSTEYGRCFTDRTEAEKFYDSLLKSSSYSNVTFQIG